MEFIVQEFAEQGVAAAENECGFRIFQRRVEHCMETSVCSLGEELAREPETQRGHVFGNGGVQSILVHGPTCRWWNVARKVL